jgi:hypothetical protein
MNTQWAKKGERRAAASKASWGEVRKPLASIIGQRTEF